MVVFSPDARSLRLPAFRVDPRNRRTPAPPLVGPAQRARGRTSGKLEADRPQRLLLSGEPLLAAFPGWTATELASPLRGFLAAERTSLCRVPRRVWLKEGRYDPLIRLGATVQLFPSGEAEVAIAPIFTQAPQGWPVARLSFEDRDLGPLTGLSVQWVTRNAVSTPTSRSASRPRPPPSPSTSAGLLARTSKDSSRSKELSDPRHINALGATAG